MKIECVLDASAVLALLQREPGEETVKAVLDKAAISAVNVAEVVVKLRRLGESEEDAGSDMAAMQLGVIPFDEKLAFVAANLDQITRRHGLSIGDRACLATAKQLNVPALTADHGWRIPGLGVDVQYIREPA